MILCPAHCDERFERIAQILAKMLRVWTDPSQIYEGLDDLCV